MLLKELLQQGKVKDKYKKEIKEYSLREKEIFISSLNNHFGTNYSKFIMEMSQVGNWAALEQKVNTLRIALLIGGLLHPLSQFKNWFNYFHAQFRRFFLNSRGIFVVLIGPDGSGKSTTVNNLIELEIKRLFQKKYYFHGHFPFLPELKKIAGFFKRNKKEVINGTQSLRGKTEAISKTWIAMPSDGNDGGGTLSGETHRENQQPFSFLRSMIYPFYYGLNYFLGHFFVWKEKARGNLIIFDRYFYDYFIQGQYDNCPRWLLYTIAKAIPKPDIVIYLKNDPEVIFNRKSELTVEEIKRQQDICEELVKRFSNSFSVVTSTPREVVEQIQRIIINRIREKQK
ncbi:MAG: hypothetical protein IBX72_14660 [Nitrospirae bacterium]|nr:hypothetical protein [Nitrospirota bacterium]